MGSEHNRIIDHHIHRATEVLADLVGAELHEQCARFPPRVDQVSWLDGTFERRFKTQLPTLPAPDSPMMALLCQFLDHEIDHEIEEIDRAVQSGAIQRVCPTPLHVETFHFLWRTLLNHLDERAAGMDTPFKRADKHRVVESLRKRSMLVQLAGTPIRN